MFEKQNVSISVNVFGFEEDEIFPMHVTKYPQRMYHVNLLLLKDGECAHFCLIKDLNSFLYRTTNRTNRMYFCPYCLNGFNEQRVLDKHIPFCSVNGPQKVELPTERDNLLQFKEYERTQRVAFAIYCDFECLAVPSSSDPTNTTLQPCGFAYNVVCIDSKYTRPTVTYRGPDASVKLLKCLLKERQKINSVLENIVPIR